MQYIVVDIILFGVRNIDIEYKVVKLHLILNNGLDQYVNGKMY